jgi:hypothetical protein
MTTALPIARPGDRPEPQDHRGTEPANNRYGQASSLTAAVRS